MQELANFLNNLSFSTLIPLVAASGGVVWVISQLKVILRLLKDLVTQCISFTVYNICDDNRSGGYFITINQAIFNAILSKCKTVWERSINLDLSNEIMNKNDKFYAVSKVLNTNSKNLTYGFSIKILYGKLVFCERYLDTTHSQKIVIKTNIRVFFANKKKFLDKLNKEIDSINDKIESNSYSDWLEVRSDISAAIKQKRSLTSIFTNNNEHIDLYNEIKKFIDNRDVYKKMNYPYKFSALLYGVPGSGKSSTLLAIASELNRNIEYINLTQSSTHELQRRLTHEKCIFVFEDIDALNTNVNESRKDFENDMDQHYSKISLSDLLNITDGLLSTDGSICLFTTNHIEKLDPALIRVGRMNKLVEFTYLDKETANRMIKYHLGITIDNLKDEIKPAELQEYILNILINKFTVDDLKQKFQNNNSDL